MDGRRAGRNGFSDHPTYDGPSALVRANVTPPSPPLAGGAGPPMAGGAVPAVPGPPHHRRRRPLGARRRRHR
eukprot:9485676-Pyramimonas_sp.AAC.1